MKVNNVMMNFLTSVTSHLNAAKIKKYVKRIFNLNYVSIADVDLRCKFML